MSDGTATVLGDVSCVLVVGDSQSADDAMAALATRFDRVSLLRERTLEGALERLDDREVHCLVCPFPVADGSGAPDSILAALAARTDERPILAVVDDENADRALEAGATDVVDRDASAAVLTARVRNAAQRERYRLAAANADRQPGSILEHATAVVWVLDTDGDIEYASPAVESRMGYTPTELERTAMSRLVHPDDRETARETRSSVAAAPLGTTERVTVRLGHGDGSWHVSELTYTNRLADPSVEGIVVTRTGVSGSESDTPARAGVDRLADAFIAVGPRGEVQYANEAAEGLFSDDRGNGDRSSGTIVWDRFPAEFGETVADRIHEARATDSVVEFETTVPALEGALSVSVHPGDDGVTLTARQRPTDATATDRSTDRDRLELYRSIVDALDDGIAVLEGETIRLANPALLALTETDALAGRDLESVFDEDLAAAVRERARSPVVRWVEPATGELATDASRPVDVFVAPLSAPDRTLCLVRDRRGSRGAALSTLQETVAMLRRVDTPTPVRETVASAIRECVDADAAIWFLVDDGRLRPATVTAATDGRSASDRTSFDPPPIDIDDTPLATTLESEEPTVYEWTSLEDVLARMGLRAERVLAVPIADRGIVLATSGDPMAFDGIDLGPVETLSDAAAMALESLEHAVARRTCRQEADRLRTTVARTQRAWETTRSLLNAPTRDAVERRLCEGIVSLTPSESAAGIDLAWVGRVEDGRERIRPQTWAGRNGDVLESVSLSLERSDFPAGNAAATGESVVLDRLDTDGAIGNDGTDEAHAWRERLLDRGFRSALSVPLEAGEFRYGTLTAYAEEPAAFDDTTRRACERLASIAGESIGAIERRDALLADRVTELEVVVRGDASEPLSSIAHRLGHPIEFRAVIPRSSGGSTVFCSVPDDADAVRVTIESVAAVDSVSVVGHGNGETVLEIGLRESDDPPIARTIADNGGVLRSLTPVDDRSRLEIDLGNPIDVRSFLRTLETVHSKTELVARRDRDRPPRTARSFADPIAALSERQRRTLEAAYYSGFFEWPREHTGEEVADSLGISQPTFSRHLRVAQRKLFESLFDDRLAE
ncbi:bacterio-opsin activator domain-containing protein [Natrinema longum]|uniref:GAF domain-containing protein n=1 Tax=Natrinema longum TaxID=370324 RepID=A0A8A2U7E4_9EURY|nr:bacterio-opsin activator domain-containing protein [Natrinema longum]MBZ6494035.1 GAF domain-containing protein [Natrinema longum]QSW84630.1 GAF domain-containing protein [Natrinema longum]